MKQPNYYEVLGVDYDASQEAIRRAYRRLAVKYHPDHNPGDKEAEGRLKEVKRAYEVLSNPQRRATFDQDVSASPDREARGGSRNLWGLCPYCGERLAQDTKACKWCGNPFYGPFSYYNEDTNISSRKRYPPRSGRRRRGLYSSRHLSSIPWPLRPLAALIAWMVLLVVAALYGIVWIVWGYGIVWLLSWLF